MIATAERPFRMTDEERSLVTQLRKHGVSHRRIATMLRRSKGAIDRLLTGPERPTECGVPTSSVIKSPDLQRTVWCKVCHAKVHPPCVACQVRATMGEKV